MWIAAITVEDAKGDVTQIWKIEQTSDGNKYHIRPARYNSFAMNVFRSGDYPCTIQPTSNNIADTSFNISRVQDMNCRIRWTDSEENLYYLTETDSKAYWTQTDSPQVWTLEPTSYTPPDVGYYKLLVVDKATGLPVQNSTVCIVPNKIDNKKANLEFFTTDENGRADIAAAGEQLNLNYESIGIVVAADGYADWVSEEGTIAPSSDLITVEMISKNEYPNYSLPLSNVSAPIRNSHTDFGWRYLSNIDYHTGIDIGNGSTSDKIVRSICDGTVVKNDFASGAGNYVMVRSNEGYYVTYMHLASDNDFDVDANKRIVRGAKIGIMSNTNEESDPALEQSGMPIHLHISIGTAETIKKSSRSYIDPKAFLTF